MRSHELRIGRVDPWASSGMTSTEYYHGDMIGTTRLMTDVSGTAAAGSQSVHTAFGQAIAPNGNHRYGYAGAWGYQSLGPDANPVGFGAPSFLHVGHRYYDPASGRFLQRDPIGITGGLNVYAYVRSRPTAAIDPYGLANGLADLSEGTMYRFACWIRWTVADSDCCLELKPKEEWPTPPPRPEPDPPPPPPPPPPPENDRPIEDVLDELKGLPGIGG